MKTTNAALIQRNAEMFDRRQARLPRCSWKGCESKAPYAHTGHEGMHADDEFSVTYCPYHENEDWFISNLAHEIGMSLGFIDPSGFPI